MLAVCIAIVLYLPVLGTCQGVSGAFTQELETPKTLTARWGNRNAAAGASAAWAFGWHKIEELEGSTDVHAGLARRRKLLAQKLLQTARQPSNVAVVNDIAGHFEVLAGVLVALNRLGVVPEVYYAGGLSAYPAACYVLQLVRTRPAKVVMLQCLADCVTYFNPEVQPLTQSCAQATRWVPGGLVLRCRASLPSSASPTQRLLSVPNIIAWLFSKPLFTCTCP